MKSRMLLSKGEGRRGNPLRHHHSIRREIATQRRNRDSAGVEIRPERYKIQPRQTYAGGIAMWMAFDDKDPSTVYVNFWQVRLSPEVRHESRLRTDLVDQ